VSYREFTLIVAEERNRFLGVAYDGDGHGIERVEGADAAQVLEQLKRLVLPRSR
jgi:hypothetical protein